MKANYKNSAVIPDTSALMKNCNVLNFLLEDFKTVIISQTTLDELNFQKDKKKNNQAWLAMQKIEQVKKKLQIHIGSRKNNGENSSALQIRDKLFLENWSEYRISESVDYDMLYEIFFFFLYNRFYAYTKSSIS